MSIVSKIYRDISNFYYRVRLRNKDFTILTDTCIGGVMYHKLGKQFLSPTINLWFHDVEFYRFVHNLDYYLSQQLRFVPNDEGCPCAYCGDILLHFNHYKTAEEAEQKWEERKRRIHKDNLFIITSDRPLEEENVTHEMISGLKDIPCRGKVVFSVRQYDDVDYIVPLPKAEDGNYVNVYMHDKNTRTGRWRWESAWDWVHWLNTGEVKI